MSTQSTTAEVILAAGRDPFTLSALVILVLAFIARSWFSNAPHRTKERIFYVMIVIGVSFGGAGVARVWPTQAAPAVQAQAAAPPAQQQGGASTPIQMPSPPQQEQACPGGMPRFADASRDCLPIPGALFVSPEMKIKLRDRCRALGAQGIAHDGYTSTSRCFDHGAG